MARHTFFSYRIILLFFLAFSGVLSQDNCLNKQSKRSGLGAILDLNSHVGKKERVALQMGIEDLYTNVNKRPVLHIKNSRGDTLRALSSARSLIKKNHVAAIIGLSTWQDTAFTAEFGSKSQVPIISLADDIPSWACLNWPFLVNAARSQSARMKAIAGIIGTWEWRKVNVIYEDISSDVNGFVPYLISALQDIGSEISDLLSVPPISSRYYSLSEKLSNLRDGQSRIFVVHTSATLAAEIFIEAKKLEMMGKDYVWITTTGITNLIDTFNASVISAMDGVLGIKTYFPHFGKAFEDFKSRFASKFHSIYRNEPHSEPDIYAVQAYDAVQAVALEMEGLPSFPNSTTNSIRGENLLSRILDSNFQGLTGIMEFRNGSLAPARIFKILNVAGKSYRELGYWTDNLGFSENISGNSKYSKSMKILGQVVWPGKPWSVPRGWSPPTFSNLLKIGVPVGNTHKEFVRVVYDNDTGVVRAEGFAIDVFDETLKLVPYDLPHQFIPFNGSYDALVANIHSQVFDAVVADTAIVAKRCKVAEFSQPYSASGLQMVIYNKQKKVNRAWLFTKPFKKEMWIATGLTNVYIGGIVWWIERKLNVETNNERIKFKDIGTMLTSAFITLFSLKGDGMRFNLTKMVMVLWLFLALVITQSYTASLTSLLTIPPNNPEIIEVQTLLQNGDRVGYDAHSFVGQYLQTALKFQPDKVVPFYSEDDYVDALVTGTIAAAFLEAPYVRVFLAKNCNKFFTSGTTFKVGGFGFVFAKGSPYLPDISEAVVSIAESGKLEELEDSLVSSYKCSDSKSDDDNQRLEFSSFMGLFVISWAIPGIALMICFFSPYIHQYCENWLCRARVHQQPDPQEQQQQPDPQEQQQQQPDPQEQQQQLPDPQEQQQQQQQQRDEDVLFAAEIEMHRREG